MISFISALPLEIGHLYVPRSVTPPGTPYIKPSGLVKESTTFTSQTLNAPYEANKQKESFLKKQEESLKMTPIAWRGCETLHFQ